MKKDVSQKVRKMRDSLGISRKAFGEKYNIPIRTLDNWERGETVPPNYVLQLLERAVREDRENEH